MPPASTRYWSWLFAAPAVREPLLGIYALMAEWRGLLDAAAEPTAARLKLAWWQEEILRLSRGVPVHPIGRYLAALPRAGLVNFGPLNGAIEAAARQIAGAPLEHGSELEAHSAALIAGPLIIAARLAEDPANDGESAVYDAVAALAAGEYLAHAIVDYRREARRGRVIFPVDELLAASIEDADLTAAEPPERVRSYLDAVRRRAALFFAAAARTLPVKERAPLRHILVAAALGSKRLNERTIGHFRVPDLYLAWVTARRAALQA